MKATVFLITCVLICFCSNMNGQTSISNQYLEQLPEDVELDVTIPRSYSMITDYLEYDLKGNFIRKTRVSGNFTSFDNTNTVRWNNVSVAVTDDEFGDYPQGTIIDYMENFTHTSDVEAMSESFFQNIPQADFYIRNLIWDRLMFICFAYQEWDSLHLNRTYRAENLNGNVNLAGQGEFGNTDIQLTWNGITRKNDELCAVIHYAAMNNPLHIETEAFSMQGRSHYWGDVVVSLEDKEIEHGILSEDVITDINFFGQPDNFVGYSVRYITLEKIK